MMRWFSILLAVSPAVALLVPAVRNLLPAAMHAPGPAGLEWWRWIAIPGAVAISGALGIALGWLTRATMTRLAARTSTIWDDQLLGRIAGPITLAWTVAGIYVMLPLLDLPPGAHNGALSILRITLLVDFFWALLRLIEVGGRFLLSTPWATENAGSRALLPLIVRVSKVVVLIIGAVAVFAELGYPVASLIAGLGIGGLAFALAAQKTI